MSNPLDILRQQIFSPRSVALIGASSDATKNTSRPQRYMRKYGYAGKLFPINPGRDEVFGEKAYPDVTAVPEDIDHAFIMVPAKAVKKAKLRQRATTIIYSRLVIIFYKGLRTVYMNITQMV